MDNETFENMKQCASATGVPYAILRAAKSHPERPPGFKYSSGSSRINWTLLKPWVEQHMAELEEYIRDGSMEALKREGKKLDNEYKRLENAKFAGRLIDVKEKAAFLSELSAILSAEAKKIERNLREQCPGYEQIIRSEFVEYFQAVEREVRKCSQN